jgi:hypothetical protein
MNIDLANVAALAADHGLPYAEPEWLPDIVARYNLTPPPPRPSDTRSVAPPIAAEWVDRAAHDNRAPRTGTQTGGGACEESGEMPDKGPGSKSKGKKQKGGGKKKPK